MRPTIDQLASRYVIARDTVDRLRLERARLVCDFEHYFDQFDGWSREPLRTRAPFDGDNERTGTRGVGAVASQAPCWATFIIDAGDDGSALVKVGDEASEGWCESCLRRAETHEKLRAAVRHRTSALGALISSTRARHGLVKPRRERVPVPPAGVTASTVADNIF